MTYHKVYYEINKKEILLQQKEYRSKRTKELKAYRKLYYKANKKCLAKKAAIWYKHNKQHVHEHYLKNYSRHLKQNAAWAKAHPEIGRAKFARRRTRIAKGGGSFSAEQWISLCNFYGNRCACCRKKKRLEADHVVPVSKGGSSNIDNIQPLCRSCNSSKGTKTTDYRKQPEGSVNSGGENYVILFENTF